MKQHALTHKNSSIPLSPSNSNSNSQFNNSSDSEEKERDEDVRSDVDREESLSRHESGLKRSPPMDDSDESPMAKKTQGKVSSNVPLFCLQKSSNQGGTNIMPSLKFACCG